MLYREDSPMIKSGILLTGILFSGLFMCFMPYLVNPDLPVLGIDSVSYYRTDVLPQDYLYFTHMIVSGLGSVYGIDNAIILFPFILVLFTAFATGFLVKSLGYEFEWCLLAGLFSVVSVQTVMGLFAYITAQWLAYGFLLLFSLGRRFES